MDIDPRLLERYWKGTCSTAEKLAVEAWLKAGEPKGNEAWPETDGATKVELWKAINKNIDKSATKVVPQSPKSAGRHWFLVSVTAACLLLLLSIVYWHWGPRSSVPTDAVALAEPREIIAPYGKKLKVILPDSTIAHLNSGSRITYAEPFEDTLRQIELRGEAYFQVKHQPDRPFVVTAGATRTEVLGTRFNVQALPDESAVSVVVEEGKVRFEADRLAGVLLTANQRATAQAQGISVDTVLAANYMAWKDNQLVFHDEQLEAVVPQLERWYAVKITLADDELRSLRIHGTFNNPPLRTLLHDLGYSLNLNYKIQDNNITLYR